MADSEARLRIVLDAINNAGDELKRLQDDLKGTGEKAKEAKGGFGELAGKFEELTGVSVTSALTLGGVGAAVGTVAKIVSDSIGRYGEYAEQVRDLSYAYSLTTEQSSELIQVLDDARVAPASLETAFRSMVDKGIQPTVENLAKMADEFVSIHDPVERAEFLSEQFGSKAGPEMAKALGLGGDALRQYGKDAKDAGLLLNDADMAAAERLKQAQDSLADAQLNFDKAVGGPGTMIYAGMINAAVSEYYRLIDVLAELFPHQTNQVAWVQETGRAYAEMADEADRETRRFTRSYLNGLNDLDEATSQLDTTTRNMLAVLNAGMSGSLTKENEKFEASQADLEAQAADLQAQLEKLNRTNGQYFEYVEGNGATTAELALANAKLTQAYERLNEEADPVKIAQLNLEIEKQQGLIAGADVVIGGYVDNSKKIGELSAEYEEVTAAVEANKRAHEEATNRILWNMTQQLYAVDGLTTEEIAALTEIGVGLGIYDAETARVMQSVQASITEHGTNAKEVLLDVNNAYTDMLNKPDIVKTITIKTTKIGDEDFGGWTPDQAAPTTITPNDGTTINGEQTGYATGGAFTVPGFGHSDRPYLVNLMPGEHVQVTPAGGEAPAGGDTIHAPITIHAAPGQSPEEIARAVNRELSRRVRQKANARV